MQLMENWEHPVILPTSSAFQGIHLKKTISIRFYSVMVSTKGHASFMQELLNCVQGYEIDIKLKQHENECRM